jgi:hypothetical protein
MAHSDVQGGIAIMRLRISAFLLASLVWLSGGSVVAQDIGAAASGDWTVPTTWAGGVVPGQSNNVYIGSTYPTGDASTATVTVSTIDELVNNLYLGYGSGTNGTLDLTNGHQVNAFNTLSIGKNGGTGTINESSGGFFQAKNLEIHSGNTLTLNAKDVVTNVLVDTGSKLNLGAPTTLTNGLLDVRDTGSVVNLNGNALTAHSIYLGYNNDQAGGAVTLNRGGAGGTLTATDLFLGNGASLSLVAGDSVKTLGLYHGTSNTLGSGVSVGSLLIAGGSTATTTNSGNVTTEVVIAGGSTLNLGAALNLSGTGPAAGYLYVNGTGTTVHMNGNAINANVVVMGAPGSPNPVPAGTLDRGGAGGVLNLATGLVVNDGTFNLAAGDKMEVLEAAVGSTVTTAATGNVTVDVAVAGGSTLNLGADLSLTGTDSHLTASGQLNVQDKGSILNAQGHAITADSFLVGQNGTSPVTVTNLGLVTVNTLEVGNGSTLTLHGGDTVNKQLSLTGGSTLNVQQTNGMGLTFGGASASDLTIDPSQMNLIFTSIAPGNWDFRWKDPSTGGDWVNTLDGLIAGGQIHLTLLPGEDVRVANNPNDGYTYIYGIGGASVPEPSSLVLGCLAVAGLATVKAWRRRRPRRE